MGKFRKFMAMAAVSCMALTVVTGCGSNGSGSSETDSNEVKIGLNFELSGETANYGNPEYNGAMLAINQANASGENKYTYTPVKGDNKSSADESTNIATKLISSDGVKGIVGPATSGASAAIYQVATDNKVLVVSPSSTTTNITLADGESVESVYDYVFRVCFEDSYQGAAMAAFTNDTLGRKKAVIFSDSSSDYAKGLAEAFKEKFEEKGGTIVSELNYQAKDTDFNVQLTKIKNMDYDVIYIPGYYNEVGLIIKQAREMGIDVPIVGGDGFDSTDLVKLAGKENLNDVFFTTAYTTVNASDELNAFIEAYKEEYGEDPSMFSALAYDATNLMIQAFEEAGTTDTEEVQKTMAGINFKGVTGSFTFDETHTPDKAALVVEIVDGEQKNAVDVNPNK